MKREQQTTAIKFVAFFQCQRLSLAYIKTNKQLLKIEIFLSRNFANLCQFVKILRILKSR